MSNRLYIYALKKNSNLEYIVELFNVLFRESLDLVSISNVGENYENFNKLYVHNKDEDLTKSDYDNKIIFGNCNNVTCKKPIYNLWIHRDYDVVNYDEYEFFECLFIFKFEHSCWNIIKEFLPYPSFKIFKQEEEEDELNNYKIKLSSFKKKNKVEDFFFIIDSINKKTLYLYNIV